MKYKRISKFREDSTLSILLQQKEELNRGLLADELFKIERYVELVLQYLRLESINSDLKLENYQLQKIINQAVKKYAPLFIRKKILKLKIWS